MKLLNFLKNRLIFDDDDDDDDDDDKKIKRCFDMKSSRYFFQMKVKILGWQIFKSALVYF